MTFTALLATKTDKTVSTTLVEMNEQDLMPGDVTVAVDYSTVNYKDALAVTGRADVIRQFPLIPGIDFAGTVEASTYPGISAGDRVVGNGWGLSQTHHGGYAQKARVKGEWLIKLPEAFSTKDAMAIGTAGYTAMLSILALEHGGLTPQRGEILVTGANGGVGSIAIQAGANKNQVVSLFIFTANAKGMGLTNIAQTGNSVTSLLGKSAGTSLQKGGLMTHVAAESAITLISSAIDRINSLRAELGAKQNRLERTLNFVRVQTENQQASESRIRDLDFADEVVTFTKNQILQQAGTAALAQANVAPQTVLQLLR